MYLMYYTCEILSKIGVTISRDNCYQILTYDENFFNKDAGTLVTNDLKIVYGLDTHGTAVV